MKWKRGAVALTSPDVEFHLVREVPTTKDFRSLICKLTSRIGGARLIAGTER